MSDALQCPYCGEEMRFDADSVHVWMRCDKCLAHSPKVKRPDYHNTEFPFESWAAFWAHCRELAEEAASKRPLRKPMTLEEANKSDHPVWMEFKDYRTANGWQEGMYSALHWVARVYAGLKNPVFGVHYRPWAFKPTDEEMDAAAWETKDDERSED